MKDNELAILNNMSRELSAHGQQLVALTGSMNRVEQSVDKVNNTLHGDKGLVERVSRTEEFAVRQKSVNTIVLRAVGAVLATIFGIIVQSCSTFPPEGAAVAAIPDPTPSATATEMLDYDPAPTHTPAPFPTPTATPTATPSIIELPPRPQWELIRGRFTPSTMVFVRTGPGTRYPVVHRIGPGKSVRVYAWNSNLPDEAWLCLKLGFDVFCEQFVALVYDRHSLGVLDEDEP